MGRWARYSLHVALVGVGILSVVYSYAGLGRLLRKVPGNISDALHLLGQTNTGNSLVKLAQKQWKLKALHELHGKFQWSEVSKTDAVVTRHFDPTTGQESKERDVVVYLKAGQSLEDLVLDLAHELTHATSGPTWDPYDPKLTAAKYMWTAIEGPGGEVDALVSECRVELELSKRMGDSSPRCEKYLSLVTQQIDREKVKRDFYRVGKFKEEIEAKLGTELQKFPLLSADAPMLYSSTGHSPYPLALIREFDQLNQVACRNSRRRIDSLQGRMLASDSEFLALRCR